MYAYILQAIRPAYVCRQYDDPLKDPAGSCPKSLLFQQQVYVAVCCSVLQ